MIHGHLNYTTNSTTLTDATVLGEHEAQLIGLAASVAEVRRS